MDIFAIIKSEVFWSAVGAIATVGSVIVILFATNQLRFDAWLKAQTIWMDTDFTLARGKVIARLDSGNTNWTATEWDEALDVCRKMDEFAGLIPYLPKRTALKIWGVPFAKAWLILEPVVGGERAKCRWPDKWQAFERLGRSAFASLPRNEQAILILLARKQR